MEILTKETLPESQEDYFTFYHNRAFDKNATATKADLEAILEELREAYRKYENKYRLQVMAKVVQLGIKRSRGKIKASGFTNTVKQALE